MRIAVVAGEPSGDQLGGALLAAMRERFPTATWMGVGGTQMHQAGLTSLMPLDRLAVMGLVEVLPRLPELWRRQRQLMATFSDPPVDLFIGIDAPDFTLPIAAHLRRRGVMTVHLVSPSVWAWRAARIHRIKRAVDLMLVLFPFETEIYERHQLPVVCVGHPLAAAWAASPAAISPRLARSSPPYRVALLPGSRRGEVARLIGPLLDAATQLHQTRGDLEFTVSAASPAREAELIVALQQHGAARLPLTLSRTPAATLLQQADLAFVASGTATLEALLAGCPPVVVYRTHPLTAWLARRLVTVAHFSLPNLLADAPLVVERFQDAVNGPQLAADGAALLDDVARRQQLMTQFHALAHDLAEASPATAPRHTPLTHNAAAQRAAAAIAAHWDARSSSAAAPLPESSP